MLTLTADDVHVWHVVPELVSDPALLRRYEALISSDERARRARFVFPADRHMFLVARALVRTTLSQYADVEPRAWTFETGPYGRPEIARPAGVPPLRFSLSHTAGLVAVAVALQLDVGIDVEGIERWPPRADDARASGLDIARRYFAPSEADGLEALPPERQGRAFLEYWTLKEAYIKATGQGLSVPLKGFAFTLTDPPAIAFESGNGDPGGWRFWRLDLSPRHVSALAVRSVHPSRLSIFGDPAAAALH